MAIKSNIFKILSYQKWLRSLVGSADPSASYRSLGELAKALGVQQAYLSRVLKEECNLNSDQLDRVIQKASLSEAEADYLLLLLEWERCQSSQRKQRLRARIERYRQEARETQNHIDAKFTDATSSAPEQAYYLDPLAQIVHMCLHIRKFQSQPLLLCAEIRVSEEKLKSILKILTDAKLILWNAESKIYLPLESNIQLTPKSPLSSVNQTLSRYKAIDQLQNSPTESNYQFSVVFSCDAQTRGQIRDEFNSFLKQVKPLVEKSPSEEVCQMNFDIFRWAK